jgi:hypothetical protein
MGATTSTRTLKVLWTLAEIELPFEFVLASATMGPQGSVIRATGRTASSIDPPTGR